jgi:hypothetical protein
MSDLLKKVKFRPYPPCATPKELSASEGVKQPPQINRTNPAGGRLQNYLKTLHELSEQQRQANEREKAAEQRRREVEAQTKLIRREPLETQILRWWMNLPDEVRNRSFQIAEIVGACSGKFKARPATREVAAALRALGWSQRRYWNAGQGRRLWTNSRL